MGESTNSIARLVKLLDDNGFSVQAIHARDGMRNVPGEINLSVLDRWQGDETAKDPRA